MRVKINSHQSNAMYKIVQIDSQAFPVFVPLYLFSLASGCKETEEERSPFFPSFHVKCESAQSLSVSFFPLCLFVIFELCFCVCVRTHRWVPLLSLIMFWCDGFTHSTLYLSLSILHSSSHHLTSSSVPRLWQGAWKMISIAHLS